MRMMRAVQAVGSRLEPRVARTRRGMTPRQRNLPGLRGRPTHGSGTPAGVAFSADPAPGSAVCSLKPCMGWESGLVQDGRAGPLLVDAPPACLPSVPIDLRAPVLCRIRS